MKKKCNLYFQFICDFLIVKTNKQTKKSNKLKDNMMQQKTSTLILYWLGNYAYFHGADSQYIVVIKFIWWKGSEIE